MDRFFIAAYGSLRPGQYNFVAEEMTHKFDTIVNGYDLFDLGAYPCVYPGQNSVVVSVLEVNSGVKSWIDRMEFGAGYIEDKIKLFSPEFKEIEASIYVYKRLPIYGTFIKSGDWSKYLKEVSCD